MTLTAHKGKNELSLQSEKVVVDGNEILFYVVGKDGFLLYHDGSRALLPSIMKMSSSVMKTVRGSSGICKELQAIISFLENSSSFELLSLNEMRQSSRGNVETIGASGKNLPSFIKGMSEKQRCSFMEKLKKLLGGKIQEVNAETKGKPGWNQINTIEKYRNNFVKVTSKEMSDGMLRLLAFIAISEMQSPEAVMLLDEVENGINTDYAESLMRIMQDMYKEKKHQLILTTHSTVFLDYVKADDIIFLYRDEDGYTKAVHLFEDNFFKDNHGTKTEKQ